MAYYNGSSWITNVALYVNGDAVIAGTLSADRIVANDLAVTSVASVIGEVTAITAVSTPLTYSNTNSVGSLTVSNSSYTRTMKILVNVSGRSGVTSGAFSGQSQAYALFAGTSLIKDYGWSPAGEDSKSMGAVYTLSPNSSVTFDARAAKTGSGFSLSYNATIYTLGVKN